MSEHEMISGCIKQDRLAQHQVYIRFGPKIMGICKRYMKDRERAEEMAMNSFLAVFQKIVQYKNEGSFEGWILRITVNCCLMELRKKTTFSSETSLESIQISNSDDASESLYHEDVEKMLKILPEGARIVFNLFAIEGYKHAEIAKMLGISEGTSKSQLNYAKEKLKKSFAIFSNPKSLSHE